MKKKFCFIILVSFLVLILTGCSNSGHNNIVSEKYNVFLQAIDSNNAIIKTAKISVDGISGSGNNGCYKLSLSNGTYTAKAIDETGKYINTSMQFIVNNMDTTPRIHMFKNAKSVMISAYDPDGSKLSGTEINIEGVQGVNVNGTYNFQLDIGKTYTAIVSDPKGYYRQTSKEFTVTKDTNDIKVNMLAVPTGNITGKLYLTTKYSDNPVLLDYGYVEFDDKKVTARKNGYTLSGIPEGEREIKITTIFGGEATKTINVIAGQTKTVNLEVPLPNDFPVDKWSKVKGNYVGTLTRWDQQTINYSIGFTDFVKSKLSEDMLKIYKDKIREGIQIIDNALADVINYEEVTDSAFADVEILVCYDGDHYIQKDKGILKEQNITEDRRIIHSIIYLNDKHIVFSGSTLIAHELGHSLGFGHSSSCNDLMYFNPCLDLERWQNETYGGSDRMIFGLVYSMPHPTTNFFTE